MQRMSITSIIIKLIIFTKTRRMTSYDENCVNNCNTTIVFKFKPVMQSTKWPLTWPRHVLVEMAWDVRENIPFFGNTNSVSVLIFPIQ